jgi:hypothetical protein
MLSKTGFKRLNASIFCYELGGIRFWGEKISWQLMSFYLENAVFLVELGTKSISLNLDNVIKTTLYTRMIKKCIERSV